MKRTRFWVVAISVDSVAAVLLYLWLFAGVEGAGSLFQALFWVIVPFAIVFLLGGSKAVENIERPPHFSTYNIATDLGMVAVLGWFGHPWMAALKFISLMLNESAHAKRKQEQTAP